MTVDDRFAQDLVGFLRATAPTGAPAGLHAAALEKAADRGQRRGWVVALGGATFGRTVPGEWPRAAQALGFVVLLTLVTVAAALLAAHRPPSRLGSNGAIVFQWQGNNRWPGGTEFIDRNGSVVTTEASPCATFSDDGRYLVHPTGESRSRLVLDPMDGLPVTEVPIPFDSSHGVDFRSYEVSPDSTHVAYLRPGRQVETTPDADGSTSSIEVDNEVWIAPVGGGAGVRVAPAPDSALETAYRPTWSPDGSQVAFLVYGWDLVDNEFVSRGGTIVVAQADGSGARRLETDRALGDLVTWSPDGRHLAYIGIPDGLYAPDRPGDVFVINIDGTSRTNVTNSPQAESEQAWAPDGSRIAFLVTDSDSSTLAVVPMTDGTPSASRAIGPETSRFTWSPDGQQLLYVTVRAEPPPWDGASASYFSALRTIDVRLAGPPSAGFGEVPGTVVCHLAWQRVP